MSDKPHPHTTDTTPKIYTSGMPVARLETLVDGVFAIVMTILVFDFTSPKAAGGITAWELIATYGPTLLAYMSSFMVLGVYWLGHRTTFNIIKRADHTLHWINIFLMAAVGLVPLSTKIIRAYPYDMAAHVFYAGNLILIGLLLYEHFMYAVNHPALTDEKMPPALVRFGQWRCLFAPACYAAALPLLKLHPKAPLLIYAAVPVLYIMPSLQPRWMRLFGMGTEHLHNPAGFRRARN